MLHKAWVVITKAFGELAEALSISEEFKASNPLYIGNFWD